MIKNKTWKNLEEEHAVKVKSKLMELGGEEKNVKERRCCKYYKYQEKGNLLLKISYFKLHRLKLE